MAETYVVPDASLAAQTQPGKREPLHKVLTALQKKKLCQLKEDAPKMTQAKLIEYATREFGITPSMSQVNRTLQRKDEFLNVREDEGNRKRNRGAKWPELEDAVDAWYQQMKSQGQDIPDGTISAKAKEMAEHLGIRPFSGSGGWLSNFKHRQGIRINIMHRESDAANVLSSLANSIVPESGEEDFQQAAKRKQMDDQIPLTGKKRGRPPGTKNKAAGKLDVSNSADPDGSHAPLGHPVLHASLLGTNELGVAIGFPAPTVYGRVAENDELGAEYPSVSANPDTFHHNASASASLPIQPTALQPVSELPMSHTAMMREATEGSGPHSDTNLALQHSNHAGIQQMAHVSAQQHDANVLQEALPLGPAMTQSINEREGDEVIHPQQDGLHQADQDAVKGAASQPITQELEQPDVKLEQYSRA